MAGLMDQVQTWAIVAGVVAVVLWVGWRVIPAPIRMLLRGGYRMARRGTRAGTRLVGTATGADRPTLDRRGAAHLLALVLVAWAAWRPSYVVPALALVAFLLTGASGRPTVRDVVRTTRDRATDHPTAWVALLGLQAVTPLLVWAGTWTDVDIPQLDVALAWLWAVSGGAVLLGVLVGDHVGRLAQRGRRRIVDLPTVVGISRAEVDAQGVRMTTSRDGVVTIAPVPAQARMRDDLTARVAAVWPDLVVDEVSEHRIVLRPALAQDQAEREVLAATGGVLRAWPVVPTASVTDAVLVFTPGRGLTPSRAAAIPAHVDQ